MRCPRCQSKDTLVENQQSVDCRLCRYTLSADETTAFRTASHAKDNTKHKAILERYKPIMGKPQHTPETSRWAETKYRSGVAAIKRGDLDDAVAAFEDAIEQQRHFPDAYLWLARLADDPELKRDYYEDVLVYLPSNQEAMRELMVLKGDLTRQQADAARDGSLRRNVVNVDSAVEVNTIELACSSCGSTLRADSEQSEIQCETCGHLEPVPDTEQPQTEFMFSAMLKEKAQGTVWRVGQHLLHCENCGAERIVTSRRMTVACPFCGSESVIKSDALNSFRQPDGIVPFKLNQAQAQTALDKTFDSVIQRLKGLFVNNDVARVAWTQSYLPYWVFDVTAKIIRAEIRDSDESYRNRHQPPKLEREEFTDAVFYLEHCATDSPPRYITRQLDRFDYGDMQPYSPKKLANITTELYQIDHVKASKAIRKQLRHYFKRRHDKGRDWRIHSSVQNMLFSLILNPVWIAHVTHTNKKQRIALVHGQTGDVALGHV